MSLLETAVPRCTMEDAHKNLVIFGCRWVWQDKHEPEVTLGSHQILLFKRRRPVVGDVQQKNVDNLKVGALRPSVYPGLTFGKVSREEGQKARIFCGVRTLRKQGLPKGQYVLRGETALVQNHPILLDPAGEGKVAA